MTRTRSIVFALMAVAIGSQFLSTGPLGMSAAHAQAQPAAQQETVRPEMAKPLQAAQDLTKAGQHKEALAQIAQADAVPNKTPYESFIIERLRGPIAVAAGDDQLAVKSLETVVASDRLAADDRNKFITVIANLHYRLKNYPQSAEWASRYLKEAGADEKMRTMQIQSYYLNNDFARAAQELRADIDAAEKAGKTPTQDQLKLLLSAVVKQKDDAGYVNVLEKLVTYYPQKDYWTELLHKMFTKQTFSDRLVLDGYRLKSALGLMSRPVEYTEMAELAMRAGFPAEAKAALDQGFESGVLGTGADAARHKRLLDQAKKGVAEDKSAMAQGEASAQKSKDGTGLVNLGYAYVTTGQYDKGIALMEQGIQKGGIKRMDEAQLHLAVAYIKAGKKQEAMKTLQTVKGGDGAAELAHYWALHLKRNA